MKLLKYFNDYLESDNKSSLCGFEEYTIADLMLCQLIVDYDSLGINHPVLFPRLFKYAMKITEKYPLVAEGYDRFKGYCQDYINSQQQ